MSVKIMPSILSADFTRLGEEIAAVEQAGADEIHVDVMDGRFVPNITIGPLVVEAAKRATSLPLDVHLMIAEPDRYLEDFVSAGSDTLIVHQEACLHLDRTLAHIRHLGAKSGVALNPATPLATIGHVMDKIDRVLIMSVNPGFGGQSFIPESLIKLRVLTAMIDASGHNIEIAIDGGVSPKTVGQVVEAGAEYLVAGSAIYGTDDYKATIEEFRRLIAQAEAG